MCSAPIWAQCITLSNDRAMPHTSRPTLKIFLTDQRRSRRAWECCPNLAGMTSSCLIFFAGWSKIRPLLGLPSCRATARWSASKYARAMRPAACVLLVVLSLAVSCRVVSCRAAEGASPGTAAHLHRTRTHKPIRCPHMPTYAHTCTGHRLRPTYRYFFVCPAAAPAAGRRRWWCACEGAVELEDSRRFDKRQLDDDNKLTERYSECHSIGGPNCDDARVKRKHADPPGWRIWPSSATGKQL